MSAESLHSYLHRARDGLLPVALSWSKRNRKARKAESSVLSLWSIRSLDDLDGDDLFWCFSAAFADSRALYLEVYVAYGNVDDPESACLDAVEDCFAGGFVPVTFDVDFEDSSGFCILRFGLFSAEELAETERAFSK